MSPEQQNTRTLIWEVPPPQNETISVGRDSQPPSSLSANRLRAEQKLQQGAPELQHVFDKSRKGD